MANDTPESGSGGDSGGLNIVATLRKFVDDTVRGIYTTSTVIVIGVDESTRRAEVELKADRNVLVDNVPIASPFATDGAGMVVPVQEGDEGLLFHAREPIEKQLATSGEVAPEGERRFTLEAGVFLPEMWLDDMDIPEHEDGEFQIALQEDGSALRMFADGRVRIEHTSGKVIAMDATGAVTIGDEASAAAVLNADAELEYEDTQPDGSTSTKTVDVIDPGTTDLDSS
jgi:hypothetical protein